MLENIIDPILTASKYFNDKILWGPWTMIFIAAAAVYFTWLSGFFQFRRPIYLYKNTFGKIFSKTKIAGGRMTPFQAVSTALAGTVGTGNIAGVAAALAAGGAGAIFWMWVMALLGMMLKTAEVTLAVHYRDVDKNGDLHGGPMYYIKKGLGWNFLVPIFCFGVFTNSFMGAALIQPHTVGRAFVKSTFTIYNDSVDPYIICATMALITGFVVIGGIKRIGQFCSRLVPVMSLVYIVGGVCVFIFKYDQIPVVFAQIISTAFRPEPVVGGAVGITVIKVIQEGMAKGMYSNEAGQGTAPMAHATAHTDHPFQQGVWGAFEVFVDTMLICTITAFAVLSTGVISSGQTGIDLVISAFEVVFPAEIAGVIIYFCILTFCLSTQIGFFVYYETSLVSIFGKKVMKYFKWAYLVPGIIFAGVGEGPRVDKLWAFATISAALCALPNLVAVFALSGTFKKLMMDYLSGKNEYATEKVDASKQYIKMARKENHGERID